MENPSKSQKIPKTHSCVECDYCTHSIKDFRKHLATRKHINLINHTTTSQKSSDFSDQINSSFICECGKKYKHRTSLSAHKKKCTYISMEEVDPSDPTLEQTTDQTDESSDELKCFKRMFTEVMMKFSESIQMQNEVIQSRDVERKRTDEFMERMQNEVIQSRDEERKRTDELMERMIEKMGNTFNSCNTNNNNFNINMFLNNECKDALNFSDFIDNIQVSHDDLENNARLGFVEGISKIFIDNLSQLTLYERPIHCTDAKRDTLYIKNDNCWNKDSAIVKEMLDKSIQAISRKSVLSLTQWRNENDDYKDINSEFSDLYLYMHKHSIAGYDRDVFYPKVMKKIAHSVPLNKSIVKKM